MLTECSKLYIESEYIIAALKALANLTYKVTMPFYEMHSMNCIEKSNQDYLVQLLKMLCEDLKEGKMDTSKEFHVPWTHIDMTKQTPKSELDQHLLKMMICIHPAEGILMQCGREYWLDDTNPCARSINFLSKNAKICLLKTWNQKDILRNMGT